MTQRWNNRRDYWRPAGECFDPSKYGVELIDEKTAKAFVVGHHYSASYPAARCRVGLFEAGLGRPTLVGVAVFSVPMNVATIGKYFGLGQNEGVELGRFVLLDHVRANAETWFLARAFKALRADKPDVKGVVSYSDPLPRADTQGNVVTPGHVGTIYQAANAAYHGRAKSETLVRTSDWQVVSRRALSKLRNDERGAEGVYARLLELGAPKRRPLESGIAYVERALAEGPFTKVRHPGNHVYTWALEKRVEQKLPRVIYPKKFAALAA